MIAPTSRIVHESAVINSENVYREGGSLFFTAKVLDEEWAPSEVQRDYAWTGKGKELRYRHESPESNINALVGHMHDVWYENGELHAFVELWGYKPELRELQKQVMRGELSVSLGYKKTRDADDNIVGIYIRELSLTPSPRCETCVIDSYMRNEKPREVQPTVGTRQTSSSIELLEKTLMRQIEDKEHRIAEMDEVVIELESKISEGNKVNSKLKEKNQELEARIRELEEANQQNETLALRTRIVDELLKISDAEARKEKLEALSKHTTEELEERIEELERALSIASKTNRGTPVLGQQASISEDNHENEESPENFAMRLNKQRLPPAFQRKSDGEPNFIEG
jgi:hypothetical protein